MPRRPLPTALLILLAFVLVSSPLLAADPPAMEKKTDAMLEEVQVVSSPIIEGNQVDSFANETTTVTKEQVWDLNAQDLPSALRRTPGVTISRYNVVGSFGGAEGGAIFIRGKGASRPGAEISVMIDGAPAYISVWNHPLLDYLSVDPANSITVYKSPQPLNFGNGLAAVDMDPKHMTRQGFKSRVTAQYGSFNTSQETAETGGKIGQFDYYAEQSYRFSSGARTMSDGMLTSYYGRMGYGLTDNWEAHATVLRTDNYAMDPGPEGSPAKRDGKFVTRDWHMVATLANKYDEAEGTLKAYWNSGQGYWYNQSGTSNDTKTDSDLYGLRAKEKLHLWQGGEIAFGADMDWISGQTEFTTDPSLTMTSKGGWSFTPAGVTHFDRMTWSIFSPFLGVSQMIGDKEGFYATPSGGIRYYGHSQFQSEWSPQAGLVFGYKDLELHGNYSRGVNYPGLNVAAFSQNVITSLGQSWRDLKAETMDHFEAGASYNYEKLVKLDLTVFSDNGHDRYVMYPVSGVPKGFENFGDYSIWGLETTATYTPVKDLSLFAGLNAMGHTPKYLPYVPNLSVSFGANYRFLEHFKIATDAQYVDEMYVLSEARRVGTSNTSKVDGYWLANAKFSYFYTFEKPKVESELFVAVQNLTNTFYKYKPGYPMPGASVSAGVALTF
jgi:iron complex outermembrane receptor protein